MANLLIRNVPESVLESLKRRASRHGRSVQRELIDILEDATRRSEMQDPAEVAATIRSRLAQSGRYFTDSADLIREDRER